MWQCGHCGIVYEDKTDAIECCGGFEEFSYQCENCTAVFSKKPLGRCLECGERQTIETVGELVGWLKKCPQDHKIRFHSQGEELEIAEYIGGSKSEKTVILFEK